MVYRCLPTVVIFAGLLAPLPRGFGADQNLFQDRMAEILADEEATNQFLEFIKDRVLSERAGKTLLAVVSFCRAEKASLKDRKTCLIRHLFQPQFTREELKR